MQALPDNTRLECRTLWISDVHLGCVHCKADELLAFLNRVECDTLYLVGDIVDVWAMSRRVHWPAAHTRVLRRILEIAAGPTRVIYIPGNHDHNFREFADGCFHNVEIARTCVHTTAAGQRMLVSHGDELDYAVRYSRLNRFLGDLCYEALMWLTRAVNQIREYMGKPYWSLAKWVKTNVSQAENAIAAYQQAAVRLVEDQGYDGIVCGHLHYPAIKQVGGITYCNDGDWVENCSALVEDRQGRLQLVYGISHPARPLELMIAGGAASATT